MFTVYPLKSRFLKNFIGIMEIIGLNTCLGLDLSSLYPDMVPIKTNKTKLNGIIY